MNTPPIKRSTCAFCTSGITHSIDPSTYANDRYAKPVRTTQGLLWKCVNYLDKEHDDYQLKEEPDSPEARTIIAKRRRGIEEQRLRLNSLMKFRKYWFGIPK